MKRLLVIFVAITVLLTGCGVVKNSTGSQESKLNEIESVELTDEYYESRWPEVTKLVWINDTELPSNVIIAINDNLYKSDMPFVIKYKVMDVYSEDYQDQLLEMKNNGESVALFNIGGIYEGENRNPYEDAVDKGLLEPLDDYLQNNPYGQQFYDCFDAKQWEALKYKGSIYSYDFRRMPVGDLCAFVNEEHINTAETNITENTTLTELFRLIKGVKSENEDGSYYPVIWDGTEGDIAAWENEELLTLMKENRDIITYYQDVDWEKNVDFGIYIRQEDFVSTSDTQLMLDDVNSAVYSVKKIKLVEDTYEPVYSCLTGVASWAEDDEKLYAKQFITMANCNAKLACYLQYGVQNENWLFSNGMVQVDYDRRSLGEFSIGSKWITYNSGLEPSASITKENMYKDYIHSHME